MSWKARLNLLVLVCFKTLVAYVFNEIYKILPYQSTSLFLFLCPVTLSFILNVFLLRFTESLASGRVKSMGCQSKQQIFNQNHSFPYIKSCHVLNRSIWHQATTKDYSRLLKFVKLIVCKYKIVLMAQDSVAFTFHGNLSV